MKSLFNAKDNAEVVARINQITPAAVAQWGKMNPAQMLAHCQILLKMLFVEIPIKQGLIGFLFGKMAKKKLLSDQPFAKNLSTVRGAKITDDRDLEKERKALIAAVEHMATAGRQGIIQDVHPFFGKMTTEEWDQLQYKHLDHHLQQFGA